MTHLITKEGFRMNQVDSLEWNISAPDGRVSAVQGLEAWKIWFLLSHQQTYIPDQEKREYEFETFQEYARYLDSFPRSSEAVRIRKANCHGTRQYLERDDEDRIDIKADPILPLKDGWGEYWIEQSYEKALDRFQTPFTFGFAHHIQEDGTPAVYHSGRILSKEGLCFDKSGSGVGEIFALKTIEQLQTIYGDRLIFVQQFPRRETPWKPQKKMQIPPDNIRRVIEYKLLRRQEQDYVSKLREKIIEEKRTQP